jgi:uncharacterized protein
MTNPFVWFHNGSEKPAEVVQFYEKLFGWEGSEGPKGMSMFSGEAGPFAGVAPKDDASQGWVPYVQVDDVDRATERATKLGARVVQKPSGRSVTFVLVPSLYERSDRTGPFAPKN